MREDRWQSLVQAAFLLEEQHEAAAGSGAPAEQLARIRSVLDGLLEVFPRSVDPVTDFEGYAVRRLTQALQRTLPR